MPKKRNPKLDLFALALFAVVVFLTLSLATFHRADPPSQLVYPPGDEVRNACGPAGAMADHRR